MSLNTDQLALNELVTAVSAEGTVIELVTQLERAQSLNSILMWLWVLTTALFFVEAGLTYIEHRYRRGFSIFRFLKGGRR
jgi:hypothetical protein